MSKVFISHSHEDKALARSINNILLSTGFETWLDEAEIGIGDLLIDKITDGLYDADYLVAIISSNSEKSYWVNYELENAITLEIKHQKPIVVPILVSNCEIPKFLLSKLYLQLTSLDDLQSKKSLLLKSLGHDDNFNTNAKFSDLKFIADDGTNQSLTYVNGIVVFKTPIYKIKAIWNVHYPYRGMKFSRKWYKDGEKWRDTYDIYDELWDKGETMSTYIKNRKGHPTGNFAVRLFIDGEYQCSNSFIIVD